MNTKKRKPPMSKITLWATAVALSLTMALGPAQNSFAKNYPRPVPWRKSANTAIGTTDGGGGGVDVDRFGSGQDKRNNPSIARYGEGKSGGGSIGATLLEITTPSYYRVIFDIIFVRLSVSPILASNSGVPQHE